MDPQTRDELLKLFGSKLNEAMRLYLETCTRLGKIVEMGPTLEVYNNPLHPYTQALLSAVPEPDPTKEANRKRIIIKGDLPSPANPPKGCNFNTRCPVAFEFCYHEPDPVLMEVSPGHFVACHRVT